MKVELQEYDGSAEVRDLAGITYLPKCQNEDCVEEFRTNDPRKKYCCYECQEKAKYRRWKGR